jgi:hypothetical protein
MAKQSVSVNYTSGVEFRFETNELAYRITDRINDALFWVFEKFPCTPAKWVPGSLMQFLALNLVTRSCRDIS